MKTTLTATGVLYDYMRSQNVKAETGITGNIYQLNRPINSDREDIVIVPLAMNGESLQEGVININIHVPNKALASDNTQPDLGRMRFISDALVPILATVWGYDWNFITEEPATPVRDGNNWFMNIRIRYWTLRN